MIRKIGVLQPPYPTLENRITPAETMDTIFREIAQAETELDLIVLPEYSNCTGIIKQEELKTFVDAHTDNYIARLSSAASSSNTCIAANIMCKEETQYFNSTLLINRDGKILAKYHKTHLTATETDKIGITRGNTPLLVEVEGTRLSFVTCLEIYFPEYIERIAALRPDIVLFPSYQRSEKSDVIRRQTAGRALDLEAYIARASYSMGEESKSSGCSMMVDPAGSILTDAAQKVGLFTCEIDPAKKRPRPAAHGLRKAGSRDIVEEFRRPQLYRSAGPGSARKELYPFPHTIAHRGLMSVCPQNSLPAFGAALALGVEEIEFDIWGTKDGELVICHDPDVDTTSNGTGRISELTWKEISRLDAGSWFDTKWQGLSYPRFEDVLRLYAGRIVMNIHVKDPGEDGWVLRTAGKLIAAYNIQRQVYFAGGAEVLKWARAAAPEISRCCLEGQQDMTIVEHGIQFACSRVQFWHSHFNADLIREAHAAGMSCNLFYADTPEDAARCLDLGIDAVLTNCANIVLPTVRSYPAVDIN